MSAARRSRSSTAKRSEAQDDPPCDAPRTAALCKGTPLLDPVLPAARAAVRFAGDSPFVPAERGAHGADAPPHRNPDGADEFSARRGYLRRGARTRLA